MSSVYFLPHDFQFKIQFIYGAIAQLVARLHGMQEVTSSTLVSSTILISKKNYYSFILLRVEFKVDLCRNMRNGLQVHSCSR